MYRLSVPINILRFRAQKEAYLQELKKISPKRVMLCGSVNDIFDKSCDAYTHLPELKEEVALLKEIALAFEILYVSIQILRFFFLF